jgi:hypothetical protein
VRSKFDRESRIWCGGRRFRLSGRHFSVVTPTCTHRKTIGCDPAARQAVRRRVTACSAGDRPGGWEGPYICSFVFICVRLFVDIRSSMLLIGGQGTLDSRSYP